MRWPAAVLWDFDGSLVDSEGMWQQIEREIARELGGELPADYHEHTIGGTVLRTAGYIVEAVGSDADPHAVADELWARAKREQAGGPIRWMPGAEALVAGLTERGTPQALVSSGHRHYLEVTLRRLDPQPFAVVVGGDQVSRGKPHPDPYLSACEGLGVSPADCLVIEDSVPGAASGNAAGCAVLVVPTLDLVPDAPRRVFADTLAGIDPERLADLFQAARREG